MRVSSIADRNTYIVLWLYLLLFDFFTLGYCRTTYGTVVVDNDFEISTEVQWPIRFEVH